MEKYNTISKLPNPTMTTTTQVTSYRLTPTHFFIQYINSEGLHHHVMMPEYAADIFERLGIIEGYQQTERNGLMILWETLGVTSGYDGEPIEVIGYDGCPYEEWAATYPMTKREAQFVADYIEQQKYLQQWAADMRSIPSLIKSFNL